MGGGGGGNEVAQEQAAPAPTEQAQTKRFGPAAAENALLARQLAKGGYGSEQELLGLLSGLFQPQEVQYAQTPAGLLGDLGMATSAAAAPAYGGGGAGGIVANNAIYGGAK